MSNYIQHTDEDVKQMLKSISVESIEELFENIPRHLIEKAKSYFEKVGLGGKSEIEVEKELHRKSKKNVSAREVLFFMGGGCYNHYIPAVVDAIAGRSEFYTSYTPYQSEASQGILQTFFEFQTYIARLTGMEIANASHYDASTSLAESAIMSINMKNSPEVNKILISKGVHPEHRLVLSSYLKNLNIEIIEVGTKKGVTDVDELKGRIEKEKGIASFVVQQPNFFGCVEDLEEISELVKKNNLILIVGVDPISLGILKPPGEYGADIVYGDGQSLGNEMYYGGPHVGFIATKMEYVRRIPGRLVGMTEDEDGNRSFCLTLQTREQHIRREKASSNICTNQALMALRSTVYLATVGSVGLKKIAEECLKRSHYLASEISRLKNFSLKFANSYFFKEFCVQSEVDSKIVLKKLAERGVFLGPDLSMWYPELENTFLVCATELCSKEDINRLVSILKEF